MSNTFGIIRSLIIYGVCLPLAIAVGYLLATPMDLTSFIIVLLAVVIPLVPVLLRWHHFLLIASCNLSAVLFFLPGRPSVWVVMALLSLSLSILLHTLRREARFLSVPSVGRPLIFLFLVVLFTARLSGGFGLKSFGSEAYGGRDYVLLLTAIIAYFAISCQCVPRGREAAYVSVFFLTGLAAAIGSLGRFVSPSLYFIFAIFPMESLESLGGAGPEGVAERLGGMSLAGAAMVWYGLARYGLRGLFRLSEPWHFLPFRFRGGFQINQPWRLGWVLVGEWLSLQGGYRSAMIFLIILLLCQFYLEGLHRSRALPIVLLAGGLCVAVGQPMVSKLPPVIQRGLSFLPLDIDPVVRLDAEDSSEWRLKMWRALLPTVPQYLLVGKGYSIDPEQMAMSLTAMERDSTESHVLAGDYHSGPLSVIIPLGIWGALGFLWFLGASFRVLHRNFRYGDPELRLINIFLFAYFLAKVVTFFAVFGSFYLEFVEFTSLVALSISVNGGVRGPAPVVVAPKPAFRQFRLARTAP